MYQKGVRNVPQENTARGARTLELVGDDPWRGEGSLCEFGEESIARFYQGRT